MEFDSKYSGQFYKKQGGYLYVLRGDGKFAATSVSFDGQANNVLVQLSGYYQSGADGSLMYQTTSGEYIRMADGWEYVSTSSVTQYSQKDAQYYVNKVIKANANILENNLFCARFASKLTDEQQTKLYRLQTRLESRNKRLINDGLCTDLKTSTPPGYSLLANNLDAFMQAYATGAPIGAVVSTATIIVVAVVIASLATAAYFAYKYMASEAEQDVKYSEELTKSLMAKLTPEEYNQLMRETRGIVTKSKLLSKFGGAMVILKWGLLAVGGYVLYNWYKSYRNG